jgi:hypothetical protein
MISFNYLGNLGRLGNQMFQYAALKGIAKNRNYEFCIPPKDLTGSIDVNVRNSDTTIYNTFNLRQNIYQVTKNKVISEKSFNFDELLFNTCPDNVDLLGYFQNEKYFKHIESEIREEYTFPENVKKTCINFPLDENLISLHIRRGDYLGNSNHPIQPLEYYEKALSYFPNNFQVCIFSDDPKWCHQQKLFGSDRFLISENNSTTLDLYLQTLCTYHIICNSSFSWWGSYLANSKQTIAPKLWFGNSMKNVDTTGIYRENWIVI